MRHCCHQSDSASLEVTDIHTAAAQRQNFWVGRQRQVVLPQGISSAGELGGIRGSMIKAGLRVQLTKTLREDL